jgi:hypothetical protein
LAPGLTLIIARIGYVFFLKFFLEFFVPREVGGTDDFNFEFGSAELETAGDIGPVGRDDLEGMQGSTARAM